jgi:hypothetical protein
MCSKWLTILAFVVVCVGSAVSFEVEEEDGDARLGFISVANDGTTSLTFNATSIQNAVILGLFLLVLGALILPLFGLTFGGLFGDDGATGYGYGYEQPSSGYEQPSAAGYNSFSKRSIEMMGPVLEALHSAYKKYDD